MRRLGLIAALMAAMATCLWPAEVSVGNLSVAGQVPNPDRFTINPYTETVKNYGGTIVAYEIYQEGGIVFRIGFGDVTTADTDKYMRIDGTAGERGYQKDNVMYPSMRIRLKGDTTSDTGTIVILRHYKNQ